ncbi:MAG: hypothetical protein GXX91_07010, partial [Verrucomicrobiaceae bacterium]|nr:hypothetical protein [Verrucomicrobiaceae bacterium]
VGFSLDHSFNDVAVLAAGGTGSSGRVGSVAFRNGNGFAVGSVEGGDEVGFEGIRANGDVSLFAAGGNLTPLVVNEAIDSLAGSIHLEGFDVAIQSPVSALSGDITVAVGAQTYSQGVGGTAMIAADLVHGGELRFLGSTGAGDTVTYADWSGAPLAFDFAWLDGIENLIGSSSASDQFHGPGAAASYRFGAGGTIEVGGVEVSGFENLFAGSGNDTFVVAPGGGLSGLLHGGGGVDLLDYAGYGSPVSVHLGAARATGFNGVTGVEIYRGSAFEDTLTGTAGNDTFTIYADNAGQVNGGTLFFSFEHLRGIGGADRFLFQNQATVGSVDGGAGDDLLQIDDRNLGGTHTYTITGNRITRNPSYLFTGLERIRLLLGPGDDTVVTGDYGLVQTFDGGAGNDFLRLGSGIYLRDSPMAFGGSTIHHSGFEGPFPPDTAPGEVLQVQTNQVPRPPQGNGFLVEDRFTPGGAAAGEALLQALSQQSGNAFSAVLAGQAVLLQLDGQQYLFRAPSSLDGSLTAPPPELIERLREQLRADGWAELAEAIEFAGPMSLISSDGPFPVDLASPVPPELLALLGNALAIDAAGELFSALEMLVFVPVTAADGVVAIFVAAVPVDEATRALLLEHLGEAAFTEMEEALAP